MKTRQVFSTPDLAAAKTAMEAARMAGVDDDDISLIARADIEMQDIPSDRIDLTNDMVPAALRGAAMGGGLGLVGGLVAIAIPPVGITLAGAGLMALVGAAVGSWSAALMGTTVENPVRRKFEDEIKAGRILVVVDDDNERADHVRDCLRHAGATPLDFHNASMLN
jgi:hypothetical protein